MLYDGLWPILNRRTSNEKKDTFSVMFSCTFFNFVKRIVCVEFTNIQTLKSSVNVEFWASSKAVDCSRDLFLVSSRVSFSISVKCWINLEWWSFRIKCNFLLCVAHTCTHVTDSCNWRVKSQSVRIWWLTEIFVMLLDFSSSILTLSSSFPKLFVT